MPGPSGSRSTTTAVPARAASWPRAHANVVAPAPPDAADHPEGQPPGRAGVADVGERLDHPRARIRAAPATFSAPIARAVRNISVGDLAPADDVHAVASAAGASGPPRRRRRHRPGPARRRSSRAARRRRRGRRRGDAGRRPPAAAARRAGSRHGSRRGARSCSRCCPRPRSARTGAARPVDNGDGKPNGGRLVGRGPGPAGCLLLR